MATSTAIVTVGRFLYGGWKPLKEHIHNGGRLPFCYNWRSACLPQVTDIEVVTIEEVITMLRY